VPDDPKDDDRSLRAELAGLVIPENGDHAVGYNTALRDVIAIFDRHEADRQKRSTRALAKRKAAGKKIGGDIPYGYALAADGETLRESVTEQRVIAAARKLRADGHSLREVARRLKARNMFPREGDEFFAAQISRMIDEGT
jgi:DNA invertase Pin-like site-specific DNA recombinase